MYTHTHSSWLNLSRRRQSWRQCQKEKKNSLWSSLSLFSLFPLSSSSSSAHHQTLFEQGARGKSNHDEGGGKEEGRRAPLPPPPNTQNALLLVFPPDVYTHAHIHKDRP